MTEHKKHKNRGKAARTGHGKPGPKVDDARDEARAEIISLQDQIKALNDKALRAMAEVENTRRRAEKEVRDVRVYAVTGFARDMLSVSDNFQRALAALSDEVRGKEEFRPFIEGVEMTGRELENIFERHGIKRISPKGQVFDPNLHQAMFEIETSEFAPGTVADVIQEGYVINGRLLRPAMVAVAKAPADGGKKE